MAAIRKPPLDKGRLLPEDFDLTKDKLRGMLRVCANNGARTLVLGAAGCGAFSNPPQDVAHAFKRVFEEREFAGRFARIVFAITDNGRTHNHAHFSAILGGMLIPAQ